MKNTVICRIGENERLSAVADEFFAISFWRFYLVTIGLAIFLNGLWYSPQTERLLIASQNILSNPFVHQPENQWLLSSYLGPIVGALFGLNKSILTFSIMHLAILLVLFSLIISIAKRKYGEFFARSLVVVFFISPISNVLLTWLGSPDVFTTVFFLVIVLFGRNIVIFSVSAFLLGFTHPEQGFVFLSLFAIFHFLHKRERFQLRVAATGYLMLIIGRFFLKWIFDANGFGDIASRADYIIELGVTRYFEATTSHPVILLASLFNVSIILIVIYNFTLQRKSRFSLAFIVYSTLAFLTVLLTLDQTRVFAIITFPVLVLLLLDAQENELSLSSTQLLRNTLTVCFLLAIAIPRITIWDGRLYVNAYDKIFPLLVELFNLL